MFPTLVIFGLFLGPFVYLFSALIATASIDLIEQHYSKGVYPAFAEILSAMTSVTDISLTHLSFVLIILIIILIFYMGFQYYRGPSRINSYAFALLSTLSAIFYIYSAFTLAWGLNYRRQALEKTFEITQTVPPDLKQALLSQYALITNQTCYQIPDLTQDIHFIDKSVYELEVKTLQKYKLPAISYRPIKTNVLLGDLLLQIGNSGIYGPFTAEANITLPAAPMQLPFFIAHERAHAFGFASETEASAFAMIALANSTDFEIAYAGQLSFWLSIPYQTRIDSRLSQEVLDDIEENHDFWKQHEGFGINFTNEIYDSFLKMQGQKRGVASYSDATETMLKYLWKHSDLNPHLGKKL